MGFKTASAETLKIARKAALAAGYQEIGNSFPASTPKERVIHDAEVHSPGAYIIVKSDKRIAWLWTPRIEYLVGDAGAVVEVMKPEGLYD